jgi:hypothetical protein
MGDAIRKGVALTINGGIKYRVSLKNSHSRRRFSPA